MATADLSEIREGGGVYKITILKQIKPHMVHMYMGLFISLSSSPQLEPYNGANVIGLSLPLV